jgi:hypothetical protein
MLSTISWNTFLLFALVGSGLYYLILLFKFSPGLQGLVNFGKDAEDAIASIKHEDSPTAYKQTKDLQTELQAIFQTAAQKNLTKEDLLKAIHLKIEPYAHLKLTSFRAALNNFIEAECTSHCSVHLDAQDLEFIWL